MLRTFFWACCVVTWTENQVCGFVTRSASPTILESHHVSICFTLQNIFHSCSAKPTYCAAIMAAQ